MRQRSRALLAALTITCAWLAASGPAAWAAGEGDGAASAPGGGVQVHVIITGMRNAKGVIRACMSPHADRFPRCQGDESAYRTVIPANGKAEVHFSGVRPGRYAIALLHDENDNGKADRVLGMMPKEGYGFSRDAKVRMGPPKFKDAAFDVGAEAVHHTISMRYML